MGDGARVLLGFNGALGHDKFGHPECKGRARAIENALGRARLTSSHDARVREVAMPSVVSDEDEIAARIAKVHNLGFVRGMAKLTPPPEGMQLDRDTYATPSSYGELLRSVAVTCDIVDEVVARSHGGASISGLSLVRPPGHHAVPTGPMGFCVFNTVSAAVRHAQTHEGIERVAVFDYDVHHGNGTQDIFYDDPSVLYLSMHQEGLWPGTGKAHETGEGLGARTTVNVPIPSGSGHAAAMLCWDHIIKPQIKKFAPHMIFVSAGYGKHASLPTHAFSTAPTLRTTLTVPNYRGPLLPPPSHPLLDAHWRDGREGPRPIAGLQFQSSTYHALSTRLDELARTLPTCEGRLAFVLEGGYDFDSLGDSVAETVRALVGAPSAPACDSAALCEEPMAKVERAIEAAVEAHEKKP